MTHDDDRPAPVHDVGPLLASQRTYDDERAEDYGGVSKPDRRQLGLMPPCVGRRAPSGGQWGRARIPVTGRPTQFSELNALLRELVDAWKRVLADNLAGAYLQGSFALGDADIHSECDFLVVTHGPLTAQEERQLRALHDEIPTRPGQWTNRLEGSYPPKDELRTLDALDREWLYIDNGRREMQWSTHCNTEVVRWTMREHGVTLAGPDPSTLVDEVDPGALGARMRRYLVTYLPDLYAWTNFDAAWTQQYAVSTLCRILYTLDPGRFTLGTRRPHLLAVEDPLVT